MFYPLNNVERKNKMSIRTTSNTNGDVLLVLNLKETFCNLETFRSDAHVIGRAQFYVMSFQVQLLALSPYSPTEKQMENYIEITVSLFLVFKIK